ncbi:MAG TPA: amino acid adenylation domain-containing protein, partial [Thermoanaerobaculia bacterium]|nr:amino acid adenylation domain-containing protein [Thermoanaerobaculia bacterium]
LDGEVRAIFTVPTLREYAATLHRRAGVDAESVPPNAITLDTVRITPDHLPLIALTQPEIDRIVATVPGGVANIQDIYPLLPLQEGMLFQHLVETEGDTYLSRELMAFESRRHLDRFLDVLQQVMARHDILRSAILWEGLSKPVQVVYRTVELPLENVPATGGSDALSTLCDHTDPRNRRLDLRRAPLLSASVAEDAERGEWLLALLVHHLICDHVTLELVLDEVRALLGGEGARLPRPVPLRNLVAEVSRIPLSEHEAYFREELGDIDEPTAPFGLLDLQVRSTDLDTATVRIDDTLAKQVRESAAQLGVPPSALFHVAWAQVLARCTGRDDVVFGTVLSGRLQGAAGADRALGMLINTLPLRVSLHADARQVVQRSYQRMVALLAHEQAPLSLARRCSAVPTALPLFTTSLNYRQSAQAEGDDPASVWRAHGLRPISGARDLANFPLGLKVDDFGRDFTITAVCARGIGVHRINAYMTAALAALVRALETSDAESLSSVDILPAAERVQLIEHFNAPTMHRTEELFVHELFERQSLARPDAVAAAFEDESLTYAELNARANQLAHYLLAEGVRPDDRVALCVERGLGMVVGVLGVLKAGAAYLPLDPAHPPERLRAMLRDAEPKLLLTESELEEHLSIGEMPIVRMDVDFPVLARLQPTHNPEVRAMGITPRSLAYVIYTSGSTGVPKGVMVEHRSLCNMAVAHAERLALAEDSRVLQFVSPAFDVCTAEMFMTLASGARLQFAPRQKLLPGEPLQTTLREHAITHVMLPVNVAALCDPDALPALRCLVAGGDVCPPALVRRWHRRVRFFNAYGPTETSVCATLQSWETDFDESIPIGGPFGNARLYVLDRRGLPAPAGVAGEIHIGGIGVARGYLNRPELTAERFLRDPFDPAPGARMYKTGDRGRWRTDGTIEFLGRNDFQVKIRGFRVELGEIEAKLAACGGVREAVVVAREDVPGDRRLVAYYTIEEGAAVQSAELRALLSAQLPEAMVPAAFVKLATMPLTTNGKVDRHALPAPEAASHTEREIVPPEGEIEQTLAAIWEDLLRIPRVGRTDNFFELGGHSLMVVGLVERLRQRGIALAVGDVFAQPTLMALAARATAADPDEQSDDELPYSAIPYGSTRITPGMLPLATLDQTEIDAIVASIPGGIDNVQDIYGLSPLQEGILFHHLIQEEGDPYVSRMVLSFDSSARLDAFLSALQRVVDRHDTLRTAFRWVGLATPVQVVQRTATLPVEEIRAAAPVLPSLLEASSLERSPLNPQQAPLLAAFVAREENNGAYLALHYHHLIGDHQSMEVLVTEAHALLNGRESQLSRPLPYREFIAQSRRMSAQQHEEYFRELLSDVTEP